MAQRVRGKRRAPSRLICHLPLIAAVIVFTIVLLYWPIDSRFSRSLLSAMLAGFVYASFVWLLLIWLTFRWEDTSPRLRMFWTVPVLLAPVAAPILTFLATQRPTGGEQAWSVCAVSHLLSEGECLRSVRWLLIAASLIPALAIVLLIWSRLSALSEVRWLFEKPWSGLGEDADTASTGESLTRAVAFLLLGLICIALIGFSVAAGFDRSDRWVDYKVAPARPDCPTGNDCREQGKKQNQSQGSTTVAPMDTTTLVKAIRSQAETQEAAIEAVGGKVGSLSGLLQTLSNDVHTMAGGTSTEDKYLPAMADIRKAIDNIPASLKDEKAVPAIGALRQTLDKLDATLKEDKSAAALGEVRRAIENVTDLLKDERAIPAIGTLRQTLDKLDATLKDDKSGTALGGVRRAIDNVTDVLKDEKAIPAIGTLRQTLDKLDATLKDDKSATALGDIRRSLDAIVTKLGTDRDPATLVEITRALDRVDATLKGENALPALNEIRQTLERIDASINAGKPVSPPTPLPQDCFNPQFLADSDTDLQAMRDRTQALRDRRYRAVRSRYVYFANRSSKLSRDDEDQITKFLSDGVARDAVLSIRGVADGRGSPEANERAAFARARTAARFVAQQERAPPLVDLRWTVEPGSRANRPHNRFVLIQLLQACR
jgi:outer membrane protein OmpA-like peptidoglycan-associated protein